MCNAVTARVAGHRDAPPARLGLQASRVAQTPARYGSHREWCLAQANTVLMAREHESDIATTRIGWQGEAGGLARLGPHPARVGHGLARLILQAERVESGSDNGRLGQEAVPICAVTATNGARVGLPAGT
ncbi:hypothetical protein Aab01nite_56750 [Paractinoplanes abujensis]|nr:hypothetical protein Aab01nite_56750 [Actinoplanes abujensis]